MHRRRAAPLDAPDTEIAAIDEKTVGGLRRSVGGEVLVGAAVLVLTALLVNAVPARSALAPQLYVKSQTAGTGSSATVVNATVDPARAGSNAIHIYTTNPDGTNRTIRDVSGDLSLAVEGNRDAPGEPEASRAEPLPRQRPPDHDPGRLEAYDPRVDQRLHRCRDGIRCSDSLVARRSRPRSRVALLLASCGGSGNSTQNANHTSNPNADELQVAVASFDITTGPPTRFLLGLTTGDQRLIGFGTIDVRVHPLDAPATGAAHRAKFLAIPATQVPDPLPPTPTLVDAVRGRGAYAITVGFDTPGVWTADVDADVTGLGRVHASTSFQVNTKHSAIAVGDRAPASRNYTIADHDHAKLAAIDSRAQDGAPVPDPVLHRTTIASALAAHRPLVVVFSTPVYCLSRFCGPTTDMVAALAKTYAGKADFVHVEIYRDFEAGQVNDAALAVAPTRSARRRQRALGLRRRP